MAKKGSAALVGAFVVGGILLTIVAIGFFGAARIFERKLRVVCYFSGNVNGLSVGSPVKFRGVPIGTVFDMLVRYRQQPDDLRVPVFLEIGAHRVAALGGSSEMPEKAVQGMLGRGLRARLETESIITGLLYVNLDVYPDTEASFAEVEQHGDYPEIPTVPSRSEELGEAVGEVLSALREADLPGVMSSIRGTLDGMNHVVNGPGLTRALEVLPPTLSSIGRAADRVSEQVVPLGSSMQGAVADIRRAVEELKRTLVDTRAMVAPEGPAAVRLESTLSSVERAAQSMRELADLLQRNPNALVVGKER